MSIILFSNCDWFPPSHYAILYENNADHDVYFRSLNNIGVKTTYPDTTISFSKESMGSSLNARSHVFVNIGTLPIENYFSNIPSDTLSIFYFHPDTISKYSWEEIQHGYKILRRYDLSIEDMNLLFNNRYGSHEIPYPPDERMKNMKMYPPYERE